MPGAKVSDVTASLKACSVRDDVRRVVLYVGGNYVHTHYTTDGLKADFQQLLIQVKRVFSIAVTAQLHRKPVPPSFTNVLNSALDDECIKSEVLFILELCGRSMQTFIIFVLWCLPVRRWWRTGRLQSRKEYYRADLQPTHSMWEISSAPARPLPCLHRLQEGLWQGLVCSFVGNHEEVQHQHKPYPSHQKPL